MSVHLYPDGSKKVHAWANEVYNRNLPIGIHPQGGVNTPPDYLPDEKKLWEEERKQEKGVSGWVQFSQETSFTGLKYIGGSNSGAFRR